MDAGEKSKFSLSLSEWWDSDSGVFKALHSMNAVRVPLIRDALLERRERGGGGGGGGGEKSNMAQPLAGCCMLDVGCGAGILSEVCVSVCVAFNQSTPLAPPSFLPLPSLSHSHSLVWVLM